MVDDDVDDVMITKKAFKESKILNKVHHVENGEELIDYLNNCGKYKNMESNPRPGLILLDLNMPKMDGRTALYHIKNNPALKDIPIVILTTSDNDDDVMQSYGKGANTYITKPIGFDKMVSAINILSDYWIGIAKLPR